MTGLYPGALIDFLSEHDFDYLSQTAGLLSIFLLVALLAERELLRAAAGATVERTGAGWLDAAIYPLLLVFSMILFARFLKLLS